MTKTEFINRARDAALHFRTVYMKGVFGAPLSAALLRDKTAQYPSYYTEARCSKLRALLLESEPIFGFDCVCFVKGILWGWNGDAGAVYGGAKYASCGMPDITVEQMKARCRNLSDDFASLSPGELLFLPGHVGIYLGGGLCAECTPSFRGGVQITGVGNIGFTGDYPCRSWDCHGVLPDLEGEEAPPSAGAENDDTVGLFLPVLKKGCKGETVRAMQALLTLRGHKPGKCGNDASFGGDTLSSLRAFQSAAGLSSDGICGLKSWRALLAV